MKIIYLIFTFITHPFLYLILKKRVKNFKEDKLRYKEKLGYSRIKNIENVIWFHVASLGEIKSIYPIIKYYQKNGEIKILITSVTLSSYTFFEKNLKNKNTIHQYAPLDSPIIISRFLKKWKPKISIFVESEIWPNLIIKSSKVSKLILLNCRISKNSFKRWRFFRKTFTDILSHFSYITAQNNETIKYLNYFNIQNVRNLGNIKFIALEKIKKKNIEIKNNIKKTWAAMSIHFDELDHIIDTHQILNSKVNGVLTFLIPRHLNRLKEIEKKITSKSINLVKISECKKMNAPSGIILVDQFGIADEVFNYTKCVFMGGSFIDHGGQNPIEPLRFGCKILYGKNVFNFTEIYNELSKKNMAELVINPSDLHIRVLNIFKYINNTSNNDYVEKLSKDILQRTTDFLSKEIYK